MPRFSSAKWARTLRAKTSTTSFCHVMIFGSGWQPCLEAGATSSEFSSHSLIEWIDQFFFRACLKPPSPTVLSCHVLAHGSPQSISRPWQVACPAFALAYLGSFGLRLLLWSSFNFNNFCKIKFCVSFMWSPNMVQLLNFCKIKFLLKLFVYSLKLHQCIGMSECLQRIRWEKAHDI